MRNWLGWGLAIGFFAVAFIKLREGDFWASLNCAVFGGICWGAAKIFMR
jgi:hypothetical protein